MTSYKMGSRLIQQVMFLQIVIQRRYGNIEYIRETVVNVARAFYYEKFLLIDHLLSSFPPFSKMFVSIYISDTEPDAFSIRS